MLGALKSVALGAVSARLEGHAAPVGKSLLTAGVAGGAVAVIVYRILRSGDDPDGGEE